MSKVENNTNVSTENINIEKSLILLKVRALKADFNVAFLVVQKLIKHNDVKPINYKHKNTIIVLPEVTKNNIPITNGKINSKNLPTKTHI